MAATYTSFGTRKALGRRYSVDPALMLEAERLAQEYALVPGREARAMQASQFAEGMALQREQMEQTGKAGMIGTAGNLLTTAGTLRAFTLQKGEPFFPIGKSYEAWNAGKAATTPAASAGGATSPYAAGAGAVGGLTAGQAAGQAGMAAGAEATGFFTGQAVTPALVDTSATGLGIGAAEGAGIGAATAAPASAAAPGLMTTIGLPAAAGYAGGKIGTELGSRIKEIPGGRKEQGAVGGAIAGFAITGGNPIGAVIGAVVGYVSEDTWICSAISKYVGIKLDEMKALIALREYAGKHYPGWFGAYLERGPELIEKISSEELDLPSFYEKVKTSLLRPCVDLIKQGDLELAYQHYKDETIELFKKYAPEVPIEEVS